VKGPAFDSIIDVCDRAGATVNLGQPQTSVGEALKRRVERVEHVLNRAGSGAANHCLECDEAIDQGVRDRHSIRKINDGDELGPGQRIGRRGAILQCDGLL